MIAIIFVNGEKFTSFDISRWCNIGPLGSTIYNSVAIKEAALKAVGTTTGNIQVFIPGFDLL